MYLLFDDATGKHEFLIHGGPEDGKMRSYLIDETKGISYAFNPREVSMEQASADFTKELQNATR